MRDEQSTGGLGRARSRGAVEAANAGAFGLRRPRTTAIPHPHLFQETPIKQDVNIQLNFVLQVQLPNGSSKVIGNDDKVALTEHLAFTAIAADDNS